jgi:hypothetical protein
MFIRRSQSYSNYILYSIHTLKSSCTCINVLELSKNQHSEPNQEGHRYLEAQCFMWRAKGGFSDFLHKTRAQTAGTVHCVTFYS